MAPSTILPFASSHQTNPLNHLRVRPGHRDLQVLAAHSCVVLALASYRLGDHTGGPPQGGPGRASGPPGRRWAPLPSVSTQRYDWAIDMNDRDGNDDRGGDAAHGGSSEARDRSLTRPRVDPTSLQSLAHFTQLQRHIAGIDLSAFKAFQAGLTIQRQGIGFDLSAFAAAQVAVTQNIARSLDFSAIRLLQASIGQTAAAASAAGQPAAGLDSWARSVASAVNLPALKLANDALSPFRALADLSAFERQWADLARSFDFSKVAEQFTRVASDALSWAAWMDQWIPGNVRHVLDLEVVAQIALEEGIPLSWIPRQAIVEELVGASDAQSRVAILERRFDEIIADCAEALEDRDNECGAQCRAAIAALRDGHDGPAQSHAANIVDSIVVRMMKRDEAKRRAESDFEDVPLRLVGEALTLRPLFRAFAVWWPNSAEALPEGFARHTTAHAVGKPGVFTRIHALTAVMLATSLTVQFGDERSGDEPPGGQAGTEDSSQDTLGPGAD